MTISENGRKLFKQVVNTMGEGEIAPYEQFLLFLHCFQKTFTADVYKPELVWERVKLLFHSVYIMCILGVL